MSNNIMKKVPVRGLIFVGLLAVTGMLVVGALLARDSERWRAFQFFPDMAQSPAYRAQEENPKLPQGITQQIPPEGTIAQGLMPLNFSADETGAVAAGKFLNNPYSHYSETSLERGQVKFKTFCSPCHGMDAKGKGPIVQRGFPPPPTLIGGNASQWPDGRLFHAMTYGVGTMPGHGHQITRSDRWHIVTFLRSIQEPEKATVEPVLEDQPGEEQPELLPAGQVPSQREDAENIDENSSGKSETTVVDESKNTENGQDPVLESSDQEGA